MELDDREALAAGHDAIRVPLEPRGWGPGAPLVTFDCDFDPLVDELLREPGRIRWLDWIEKLSGVEPVHVAGQEYTIETRWSSPMFSGAPTAKGYDFTLQQVQSWHYDGARLEEDPYTGTGGETWKNLILTLPGETAPDEVVLLTAHLDSKNAANPMDAPGANDDGTGVATLFEAARLLRRYRFERTVKIIWFTGEELGYLGSLAYVDDHPTDDIVGVLNMDTGGWDGDQDRCMEIHVGTLSPSQGVGTCFADVIDNYGHRAVAGLPDLRRHRPVGPRLVLAGQRRRDRRRGELLRRRPARRMRRARPEPRLSLGERQAGNQRHARLRLRHRPERPGLRGRDGRSDRELFRRGADAVGRARLGLGST